MVNRSPPRVPDARGSIHCTGAACCDHPKRIRHAATWHWLQILLSYSYIPHTSLIHAIPFCGPTPFPEACKQAVLQLCVCNLKGSFDT